MTGCSSKSVGATLNSRCPRGNGSSEGYLLVEIFDIASLLGVVLDGPDADTAIDGMHRVVLEIRERAEMLQGTLECR